MSTTESLAGVITFAAVWVVIYGGLLIYQNKRWTGRAEDAALFTRSALKRHAEQAVDRRI